MVRETEVKAGPGDPVSAAALARYGRRMRPWRIGYAVALTVSVVVALVVVKIAYSHGEISHVSLKTVAKPPPSVPARHPAASIGRIWSSTDATAIGTPFYRGTVITHDQHTVRGRNAATGEPTWSYTRTDRTVCTAMQDDGLTVAVYKLHGNCDELTALDSGTGRRKWTRTLDKDTAQFDGPATFQVQPGNFFFVSATSIYAIAPGGLDYWTFHHVGCTIHSAVLGSAGALISQTCTGEQCDAAKFCANGNQLLLRDATSGYDNNSDTNGNNPDKIKWNDVGSRLVPTVAGLSVGAREPGGGALHLLNVKTGKPSATLRLGARSDGAAPSAVASTSDADLIWIGGRTYALPERATSFRWQHDMAAVPTIDEPTGLAPALARAELSVPTSTGVGLLDPATGTIASGYAVGAPRPDSLVYRLGGGFLVTGPQTSSYQ